MKERFKVIIQNIAILMLICSGISKIIFPFLHNYGIMHYVYGFYTRVYPQAIVIHNTLNIIIGFLTLLLVFKLYKRIRYAWIMQIIMLIMSMTLHIFRTFNLSSILLLYEAFILIVLLIYRNDFKRRSNKITVKYGIIIALFSICLIILYTAIGFFSMKGNFRHIHDFNDALYRAVKLLFFMDIEYKNRAGRLFAESAIIFNWICISLSFILILKPLIYNPIISKRDKEKVRRLVMKYGENTLSYLALDNDKRYYFSNVVEGTVAFTIVADVAVCCGDIICPDESAEFFILEFIIFCRENGLEIVLLNVSEKFLKLYKKAGFGCVKYGEDAMFQLSEYNLKGGRVAKVRAAINHANRYGITVEEYEPLKHKEINIEDEINEITKLWKENKHGEMSFMLGGTELDNPMDRRYFFARNAKGKMLGFVVFIPFQGGKGYLADVTRRLPDAPQGVIEKIIYEAFMVMKSQGVEWGSMGLAPLANVRENDKNAITGRLFEFIYENLNNLYSFKTLHHSKEKYAPTQWESRYMVYHPKIFTPKIAYAIVKAQNPKGIYGLIKSK
ncbi:MAG: phosphatidylglycerol lysyltransferase domain-containing protein [Clostridium sp.]|uniref:phosphatidylglycerol lysyltransferase domain-containing protein n=1 Tax=Clostridium sp. TaxID=1506 RepID=UPI0039EC2269